MVILLAVSRGVRSALAQRPVVISRWSSNNIANASDNAAPATAELAKSNKCLSGKTVSKKKYEELPKRLMLDNGKPAPPLPSWSGGLEDTTAAGLNNLLIPHTRQRGGVKALSSTIASGQASSDLPEKTKRKRKKALDSTTTLQENILIAPAKEKRRRSPKRLEAMLPVDEACMEDLLVESKKKYLKNPANQVDASAEGPTEGMSMKIKRLQRPGSMSTVENVSTRSDGPEARIRPSLDIREELVGMAPVLSSAKYAEQSSVDEDGSTMIAVQDVLNTDLQDLPRRPRNHLAREILENLAKFPHCILLTRVGQFYESYFDQAQEVSRLLSIKLTKRSWDGHQIWMCGFPLVHLDKHLKTLIQHHKRSVAMCEEFPRPCGPAEKVANIKAGFDRRVVRVLTPGTLIDESFLNPYENNYLLAISSPSTASKSSSTLEDASSVGLAWIDVSTGEFFAQNASVDSLRDHLARINPREVVLDRSLQLSPLHAVRVALTEEESYVSYIDSSPYTPEIMGAQTKQAIDAILDMQTPSQTAGVFITLETSAITLLTTFLNANLLEHMPQQLSPSPAGFEGRMQIDAHTIKALEIREGMREGGTSGSLMSVIKRTVTSSGTRLLARWLCSPSTSLDEINARQSLVQLFISRRSFREDLIEHLKSIEDASRIVQRFLLGRGNVEDLSSIRHTINVWASVMDRISLEKSMEMREKGTVNETEWASLDTLMLRMNDLEDLSRKISFAVEVREVLKKTQIPTPSEDDGTCEATEDSEVISDAISRLMPGGEKKWTIKPQYSPELTSLHNRLRNLQIEKQELQAKFQQQYNAPSLSLRLSPGHGMHVHIAKAKRDLDRLNQSRQFVPIAGSNSTKTYFNQAWFLLGNSIVETVTAIFSAEKEAFASLRSEVNFQANAIRRNARIFDEIDVTSAFANLATELNFAKPVLNTSKTYDVVNGRHPTVELGLLTSGRMFTPNSISFTDTSRLHIITGPNMAGKSTFLRQIALISILAQIGSYVPADSAEIGLVDKVFSRVGAKDDLFRDRSTFMVEMMETADILKRATDRSLVIMDEVGRGTTVKDGLAIAFATVHHLYSRNRCRALFATHFHEVADMLGYSENGQIEGVFSNIGFFCTDVDETEDGRFAYSHRLRPGVNRDSHGLKVAQLGGMPTSVVETAEEALLWIRRRSGNWVGDKTELQTLGKRLAERKSS